MRSETDFTNGGLCMNGEFKLVIGRAVREMAQFYSSEESFAIKKGKHFAKKMGVL